MIAILVELLLLGLLLVALLALALVFVYLPVACVVDLIGFFYGLTHEIVEPKEAARYAAEMHKAELEDRQRIAASQECRMMAEQEGERRLIDAELDRALQDLEELDAGHDRRIRA